MNRKRGAQPGNRNAIKHGFYSDQFNQAEKMSLSLVQSADLTDEIQLFRVQLRRYLEAETVALGRMDYETRLQALHIFSLAAECFNRLVRTQAILNSKPIRSENASEGIPQLYEPVA
ncbi:MAG: hypothetical protein MUO30_12535 [Anaerolineales bacterium]|nr:hypothetical protein [Anaerolineales bacterium]